jgi:RluA family pseudouridine synthase
LSLAYSLIHVDPSLVAVNKPSGLAVLPGRGRTDCLLEQLRVDPALAGLPVLPVHRLDADTSGVLVFARSTAAQRSLSEQFRLRSVNKEYLALVRGSPLQESGSIVRPIGIDPRHPKQMIIGGRDPRPAETRFTIEQRFRDVTLLRVQPLSGRRHQIRVHLKAWGYPLVYDALYGGTELLLSEFKRGFKAGKYQTEKSLVKRLTLHAHRLTLQHPDDGREVSYCAEIPKDLAGLLKTLTRWAPPRL